MFELPELPYTYEALEPYFDARTMEVHHLKHHGAYTHNLNVAIKGTALENQPIEHILHHVSRYPAAVRNNGGGYYNHNLFWSILSPKGSEYPSQTSAVYLGIAESFGTFENFEAQFRNEALSVFGSGWVWLCVQEPVGDLYITSTPNQDNPLMDVLEYYDIPILGLDVWEHAYYLQYQNRRADYIDSFFNIINWDEVNIRFLAARE